jgi:hypothetical protein
MQKLEVISQYGHLKRTYTAAVTQKITHPRNEASCSLDRSVTTVKLLLSGLTGTPSHPDMQKVQIIGFFFEYGL